MDMYKSKWTSLQNEIFRFLCIKSGDSFSLRAIAKNLEKSPTAVSKAIKKLEKENFISIEKSETMNLIQITLNRENSKVIELKRTENLKLVYQSKIISVLEETFPGSTIILFGSYSKGEDTLVSDIDIAIIGSKEKNINKILKKFERKLEREIRINFYSSFKEINKELKENLFNGIVLSGGIEL